MTNLTIETNEIKGTNEIRVVLTEGKYCVAYNIDSYTYTAIARTLLRCGNIETANNLLISNGGKRIECLSFYKSFAM